MNPAREARRRNFFLGVLLVELQRKSLSNPARQARRESYRAILVEMLRKPLLNPTREARRGNFNEDSLSPSDSGKR